MEWHELKDTDDIKGLLELFGHFHDSVLKELLMWTDSYIHTGLSLIVGSGHDTKVRMLFQRQFNSPSAIELLFEGVTHLQLKPSPENYDSIIYEACLLHKEEHFIGRTLLIGHPVTSTEQVPGFQLKRLNGEK